MAHLARGLRAQGRRAVAMLVSVAAAVAAFLVLTASAESTSLQLTHTVNANFRSSYDLLVRPADSRTPLERDRGLVRPNYLSGVFGGISRRQLQAVRGVGGVEVAAPIAMVGTVLESVQLPIDLTAQAGGEGRTLLRYSTRFVSQRGLTSTRGQQGYVYVTPGQLNYRSPIGSGPPYGDSEVAGGRPAMVCPEAPTTAGAATPFDLAARWSAWCWSRTGGLGGQGWSLPGFTGLVKGRSGAILTWSFPVTLAAIDPEAEAKLTGIDHAMVQGRFLKENDPQVKDPSNYETQVPVIVAKDALVDEHAEVTVDALPQSVADRVAQGVTLKSARRLVQDAKGKTVQQLRVDANTAYQGWRQTAEFGTISPIESFWTPSPVTYAAGGNGHLEPRPQHNDSSVWASQDRASGFVAVPADAADTAYRTLTEHQADQAGLRPRLDAVGTFDTAKLPGFSKLSKVPLETYQPPTAKPGSAETRRALGGRDLLPNLNPAGYLQAPPLALTTLAAVGVFSDRGDFPGVESSTPISAIRIRIAGVTGTDDASRQRIQLVANQIRDRTGLDVDVTIGSSPAPETIDLPASHAGTPALSILEGWAKKGVAFTLVDKIDRKSLMLFLLILVASALTVVNAAGASVRARRIEFGVLACLGWRPGKIYRSVCVELATLGGIAGILGALAALPLSLLVNAPTPWVRALLAIPTALVITVLAGLLPAWRASRAEPVEAVRPAVRPARRASRLHGITSLSAAAVRRTPARTATGALALALGVCAMGVLIGILLGFRGAAVGTLLGDAIAVQVRTPDIVAAGVLAILAFIALADILYLDVHEQAPNYASLKASGWRDTHLARLVITQAGLIATLGGVLGTAAALGVLRLLGALTTQTILLASGIGVAGVILSAFVALAPALTLIRLHPAEFLAQE